MNTLLKIIIYTTIAGACIPVGGLLAKIERIHPNWLEKEFRHFVIAFGGGVLLAAVALVLIPEGMICLTNPIEVAAYVVGGGLTFFAIEWILGQRRREAPQFSAMLLDYLPESLALGGIFAVSAKTAPLLAILIGLQNLPEGFNAYRELNTLAHARPTRILLIMCALIPLGPFFGLGGWIFLSGNEYWLGAVMLFSSGGILYLIFQDIAPQSRLRRHWGPPLGAVFGFSLSLLGKVWISGI
jgi:ZIP family zinc transporter